MTPNPTLAIFALKKKSKFCSSQYLQIIVKNIDNHLYVSL